MHANAPFIVQGSLHVNGEKWDSTRVIFTGDRLDEPYKDFPASWPGLVFTESSHSSTLQYVSIKNSYQGIVIAGNISASFPQIRLNECIIDNAYEEGIFALNASILAQNLLISNCGKNLVLANGGNYQFNHCTIASFSNSFIQHKSPVLLITNYLDPSGPFQPLNANFTNSIFWGDSGLVENEVVLSRLGTTTGFNVSFDHILWRVKNLPVPAIIIAAIETEPGFDSINVSENYYDFRLKENAGAKDAGILTGLNRDLDGALRPVNAPDLGAFERQ
jgi:hypothetical protein